MSYIQADFVCKAKLSTGELVNYDYCSTCVSAEEAKSKLRDMKYIGSGHIHSIDDELYKGEKISGHFFIKPLA